MRAVHAAMALAFVGVWLTAEWDGLRDWHVACGHALAAAWLLRLAWSFAQPGASLVRWSRNLVGAARRLRAGHIGALGPATWSVGGLALVVCAVLVLVPGCFVTGFFLDRLGGTSLGLLAELHRCLGEALAVAVATHLALIGVLSVLRGRCMACKVLPGGADSSGKGRH